MGTEIHGWVEVNSTFNLPEQDEIWLSAIRIGALVLGPYALFGYLFRIRATCEMNPVAANRGLPANADPRTRDELEGSDSLVGQSWLSFEELKPHLQALPLDDEYDWGWKFIFGAMQQLSEYYGPRNVWLVVAFDNYG
jgi:hypothetical protein